MYTLEIPVKYNALGETTLAKRFRIGERIYNTVLNEFKGRLNCYKQSKIYSNLIKQNKSKLRSEKLVTLQKDFGLDQSSYDKYCSVLQKHYKMHFDSQCVQKIGISVKKAIDDLMYGKAHTVHYKRKDDLSSVEGKTYTTGIKFSFDTMKVEWLGLELPLNIRKDNTYIESGLSRAEKGCTDKAIWEIDNAKFDDNGKKIRVAKKDKPEFGELCYIRLVRKFIKNKYKYYAQLIINSSPPEKGNIKHNIGDAGLDMGISTVAVVSKSCVLLKPICDLNCITKQGSIRAILQRKLDRQFRANNPNNYNSDGTIKRGIKLIWIKSKRMLRTIFKIRDINRKLAVSRKTEQNILANEVLSTCNKIMVENMSMKSMQVKTKVAKVNEKTGRYKSRKRFGKVILNYAPGQFLTILKNKASANNVDVIEVNTKEIKASQYCHINDTYVKKKLSTRWNVFEFEHKFIKVQRDLYSAFLLMNVENNIINKNKCTELFNGFLKSHNTEISRLILSNKKYPSAMGI